MFYCTVYLWKMYIVYVYMYFAMYTEHPWRKNFLWDEKLLILSSVLTESDAKSSQICQLVIVSVKSI